MTAGVIKLAAFLAIVAPMGAASAQDVTLDLSGYLNGTGGFVESDSGNIGGNWQVAGNAEIRFSGSMILDNGIEIGVETQGKLEEDVSRLLPAGTGPFGGQLDPNCSITPAASALGFTCFIIDPDEDDFVQEAFVFVDSGIFGRLQFGRQNGVGEQLSFSTPNLFYGNGVSNWETDLSAFNLINTRNTINNGYDDFAFKVMYSTPRVMGAQVAVSFAPDTEFCGAILCPSSGGVLFPDYGDILEVGVNYFHTFRNGMTVGVSGTYLSADADGTPAVLSVLEDYQSWNVGANFEFSGFTVGASYKQSNLGREGLDYTAYDVGATYETGSWGFMLAYGGDENDLTGQDTRAFQGGVDFSFDDKLSLGSGLQIGVGAQYTEGEGVLTLVPGNVGPMVISGDDESMVVFLETLVSF